MIAFSFVFMDILIENQLMKGDFMDFHKNKNECKKCILDGD